MTSRMVYEWLNTLPLFLFAPVIFVLGLITICSASLTKDKEKFVLIILTKLVKGILGGKTGVFSDTNIKPQEDELGIPLTYIHGKKVSCLVIKFFGLFTLILLQYTWAIFWDLFLTEESSNCDSKSDCFVDGGGNDPVDNCTEILMEGGNITFTCYKYVFAFGTAIGVSGGFITALSLIFSVIAGFWLFWYDLIKKKGSAFKICLLLQYTIAFSVIVIISIPILKLPIRFQLQPRDVIERMSLIVTLFFSLGFPWCYFSQIFDK